MAKVEPMCPERPQQEPPQISHRISLVFHACIMAQPPKIRHCKAPGSLEPSAAPMAFNTAQRKSLAVGFGLIAFAAVVIVLIWVGTYLPGFAGEVFSMIAGIMWSPILLDISLFVLGLTLVFWINHIRRQAEGDEFVYLETVDAPDVPADLPAGSRSAVFPERPGSPPADPALAAIEGALDLEDADTATKLLFELPEDTLGQPGVLALRIRLAELTGRADEVRALRKQLDEAT